MSVDVIHHVLAAFLMVITANVVPWASGRLFGRHWAWPLDCGLRLADGTRLLGDHKTWRGVVASEIGCALIAPHLGYSWSLGIAFASLSLAADAVSSFVKRRLRLAPGTEVVALDQLPEALLPLLLLATPLGISVIQALALALLFLALDMASAPLRHPVVNSRR